MLKKFEQGYEKIEKGFEKVQKITVLHPILASVAGAVLKQLGGAVKKSMEGFLESEKVRVKYDDQEGFLILSRGSHKIIFEDMNGKKIEIYKSKSKDETEHEWEKMVSKYKV